jgi:hypothetical protein
MFTPLGRLAVRLSAAGALAAGVAGSMAALGKNADDGEQHKGHRHDHGDGQGGHHHDRPRHDRARHDNNNQSGQQAQSSEVQSEKNNNNNNNGNNNNNNNNNSNNDNTDTTDNTNDGGGNEKHHPGNAGSDLFDRPLATKARRRAKDFAGQGNDNQSNDDGQDHGVTGNADSQGETTYQTGSISFTSGPDGIEIHTRNINYTAAPTPTPTPMPRLVLPGREPSATAGAGHGAQPTAVPVSSEAPAPVNEPPDTGDTAPAAPPPADTTGGNNSMGFSS